MRADIIPVQRRNLILEHIRQRGVSSVNELADAAGVSLPTIRRDLDWLAKSGAVERSYGGATLKSTTFTTFEPEYHVSASMAREEKVRIGNVAADKLNSYQSVIFDSSSTVFEAARSVVEKGLFLTAVTNDLRIGGLFAAAANVRLIVCGGALRPGSYTLTGEPGISFLKQLYVDVAVLGIHAIYKGSCCDTSLEVISMKRGMVGSAKKILLLVDSSKFSQVAFAEAFTVDSRFEIITDRPPPRPLIKMIVEKGATVTIA